MQSLNLGDTIDYYYHIFENDIYKINSNNYNNEINTAFNNYYYKIKYELNSYKNIDAFIHLELLSKYLSVLIPDNVNILITTINQCMYGQKILYKIKNYIKTLSNNTILNICNASCSRWTLPIYLFYLDLVKKIPQDEDKKETLFNIIIFSFNNTDDRIYKEVITNHYLLNIFNNNKEQLIERIITCLMSKNIPGNYILRRLKYLNKIIPDLHNHFDTILFNLKIFNIHIFPTLMKYYYINYKMTFTELNNISAYLLHENNIILVNPIYSLLSTDEEKNTFIIALYAQHGTIFEYKLNNITNKDYYIESLKYLFDTISYHNTFKNKNYCKEGFKYIITSFDMTFISNIISFDKLNESYINIKETMLLFLPYTVLSHGKYHKEFNIIRYTIIKYIKRIKTKKAVIKKLKIYPILNELKNLKPNNNIPVFNNGTEFYQKKLQLFNEIPPYHLYPGQLSTNNMECLLKEKADGVLVNSIPTDIYPEIIFSNKIKAEYIEELDLYMVFDIDIPNTTCERHLYIHTLHKYGQSSIPIINNLDEMIELINYERKKLDEFLKLPYNNYRWYPKPAWRIINIKEFIVPLTDIINMNNNIDKWICNDNNTFGLVHYDGVILTPLNNNLREIKIKPKKYYTIDLLYKNNKWLDRDNIEWTIQIDDDIDLTEGIWRCYPVNSSSSYVAKEIRNDKLKPNTNYIVSNIIELYNMEYKYSYPMIYHDMKTNNNEWTNIIKLNNNILERMINIVNKLKHNGNILDCGCGYGRTLKYLKNFHNYMGLDMDINLIAQSINKYSYDNKILFNYCDLNNINSLVIRENYYDVVLMINSVMHFSTDVFWNKINSITKKNSIILLNLVNMENNTKYTFDKYFIERKDDIIYYQFPIHNSIKEEKYVDINKIIKYGWKIIETFKPNKEEDKDNLTNKYIWYILTKV